MKRFLCILLCVCLLLCSLPAFAAEVSEVMQVVNCTSFVSLRASADTGASVLARVNLGEQVTDCQSAPNGFVKCTYNGQTGYILERYLSGAQSPDVITLPDQQVTNCTSWVSLRRQANATSERLAQVPLGAKVESCSREGDYVKCTYNGQTGYILSKYLKEYKEETDPDPVTPDIITLPDQQVTNCTSWVSLRKQANTTSERLAQVPYGAKVESCSREGDYVKCTYNGQTGYILAKYLKEYKEPDPTPVRPDGRYTFNPKLCSVYTREVFGSEMIQAWFDLVDAVMEGKDTFACRNNTIFDWVMGQFPVRYLPVLTELIDYPYDRNNPVKNGQGQFTYKVSRAEARRRIEEFGRQVEDVLNDVLEPDYSDFEKALALYIYFSDNYVYDYDKGDKILDTYFETSPYNTFITKLGICSEMSKVYSFLLLQAGVEATTMMGYNHEWSYIKLNGKNYHVDPTWVVSNKNYLGYFLMTDDQRNEGGFTKKQYIIVSNYSQDHSHPSYSANDETFKKLWRMTFTSFDHDTHTVNGWRYGDDGEKYYFSFDYSGY